MEVGCENCGARYLFDEARVPDAGLSVKCSKCSHVFLAARDGLVTASSAQPGQTDAQWMLRNANGDVLQFRELSTLQRWIVELKVTRDDQISRTGVTWERVGGIGELEPFFKAVEGAAPAGVGSAGNSGVGVDPGRSAGPFSGGTGSWKVNTGSHGDVLPASFDVLHPPSYPDTTVEPKRPSGDDTFRQPRRGPDAVDDELADVLPQRRGKGRWVVALLLLAVAGGLGAQYYRDPDRVRGWLRHLTGVPAAASQHLAAGYQSFDRNTEASLTAASAHFEKALLVAPSLSDAQAALAEVSLARAEGLADEAAALAARILGAPDADKAMLAKQADAKRVASLQHLQRAFELAKEALDRDTGGAAPNRAMADYYRLAGNNKQMEPLLEQAFRVAPGDPRTAYVRGASLVGDPTRMDAAAAQLAAALTKAPLMHRARYRLAELYHRRGNTEAAVGALEKILADAPDHRRAQAMLERVKLPAAPEPPPPAPPAAGSKTPPVTVRSLLAQADRLRDADQAEQAVALYDRALDLDNSDPDVHTGLGWCYVDLDRADAAITSFKRALSVAPRFSDAHMGLAEAYRAKGMKRDAVKHYRKYLDVLPDGPDAAVARRMLKRLTR